MNLGNLSEDFLDLISSTLWVFCPFRSRLWYYYMANLSLEQAVIRIFCVCELKFCSTHVVVSSAEYPTQLKRIDLMQRNTARNVVNIIWSAFKWTESNSALQFTHNYCSVQGEWTIIFFQWITMTFIWALNISLYVVAWSCIIFRIACSLVKVYFSMNSLYLSEAQF